MDGPTPLEVEIGAKIDKLIDAAAKSKAAIQSIGANNSSLMNQFGSLGNAIAGAFSIAAVVGFVTSMGQLGEQTERVQARLGTTAETTLNLGGVATVTGTTLEAMATAMERMSLSVQKSTKDSLGPQAQALKILGLNAKDLIGLPADKYFEKLADATSKLTPSLNLTNALMVVGGRGIAEMIPTLRLGGEAYKQLQADIAQARKGMADMIPGMAETDDKMDVMKLSLQSMGAAIFTTLKPAFDVIIDTIKTYAQIVRDSINGGGAWWYVFEAVAGVVKLAASAFVALATAIEIAGLQMKAFWNYAKNGITQDITKDVEAAATRLRETMDKLWNPPTKVTVNPPKTKGAGAIDYDAKDAQGAAISRLNAEIAIMRAGMATKAAEYQRDVDMYQMTEQQKLALTRQNIMEINAVESAGLQAIRDKWPAHSKQWEDANKKMLVAAKSFATEMVKVNADMARDIKAKLDDATGAFQSSFNGQLRGLLAGTTTWKEAFRTVMGDMAIYAIQAIEKMVFNWVTGKIAMLAASASTETAEVGIKTAGEAAKTGATVAGVAARTAAEEVGFATALGMYLSDALASIGASVAKVFAGITAFLAPIFGPAAPAAAIAIAAGVGATAYGLIQGFDVGTDRITQSGLAMVHEGEKIIPAQSTGPYTGKDEQRRGGDRYELAVHAIDTQSGAQFIMRNKREIAKALGREKRRTNT